MSHLRFLLARAAPEVAISVSAAGFVPEDTPAAEAVVAAAEEVEAAPLLSVANAFINILAWEGSAIRTTGVRQVSSACPVQKQCPAAHQIRMRQARQMRWHSLHVLVPLGLLQVLVAGLACLLLDGTWCLTTLPVLTRTHRNL